MKQRQAKKISKNIGKLNYTKKQIKKALRTLYNDKRANGYRGKKK